MRLLLAIGALALHGCSGSDTSSSAAGDSGLDTSTTPAADASVDTSFDPSVSCYVAANLVVDGVPRGMRAQGCGIGSTNAGVVLFGSTELAGLSGRTQIQFYLDEPIAPGFTGPVRVKDVKMSLSDGTEARKFVGTSCTLTVTRNEVVAAIADAGSTSDSGDAGKVSYSFRAWGNGSCSAPFTPETTGTLSIGTYEFKFEVDRE